MTTGTPSRTRADIQGLRAVAVLLVIAAHAGVPFLPGGFVGVDVFFVVSGFLITSLLLREAGTSGRVDLLAFYARRARRILPAATLVLVAVAVYAALALPPTRVRSLGDDIVWCALFLANVHFAQVNVDYFAIGDAPSAVQHYWSLAVEEQFYLVWPVLLLLVVGVHRRRDVRPPAVRARQRARLVVAVAVVAWCASLLWSVALTDSSPTSAYFSSLTRAWELATGVLLAMAASRLVRLPRTARHVLGAVGLLLVVVAALTFSDATPFPGWRALLPVLGTVAILAAGCGASPSGAARVLTVRPLPWVGDLSYSLYLWHWPVLLLGAASVASLPSAVGTGVLLLVTLALATAAYYLVENPVRRSRSVLRGSRRPLVLWPVAVSLVAASLVWSTHHADGVLEARMSRVVHLRGVPAGSSRHVATDLATVGRRIDDALRRADKHAPIPFPLDNYDHLGHDLFLPGWECFAGWEDSSADLCPVGDTSSPRTVVVLGDSFLMQWLSPLAAIGQQERLRIVPLIKLGCVPFDVPQQHRADDYPSCPAFRTWALEQIRTLHPDLVVVGYRGLFNVVPEDGHTLEETWSAGVDSALRRLQPLAPLEVLSSTSPVSFSPWDCLSAADADMGTCTSYQEHDEIEANALTREVTERLGIRYVDSTALVCRHDRCPLVVDRVITHHDAAHVTRTWAMQVVDALARRLDLRRMASGRAPG